MKILRKYLGSASGSILPLTAVLMPVLLGMVGLGVDVSVWLMDKHKLQTAADAAVLAAAWEVANGDSRQQGAEAALAEARNNGYDGATIDLVYDVDGSGQTTVQTTISNSSRNYFSSIIYKGNISPTVTAGAVVTLPDGDYCMLSLDPTAESALEIDGNVEMDSAGCGLAVNSNADPALNVNGGGHAERTVADIGVVGKIDGAEEFTAPGGIREGVTPFADPYADLDIPPFTPCTDDEDGTSRPDGDVTVYCGGMDDSAGPLAPGIYIIDGGDLSVSDTLSGEGVTIIMTSSSGDDYGVMDIKGTLDIDAPREGDLSDVDPEWQQYEGVAIYQDRNTPYEIQNHCNDIKGDFLVNGTTYLPSVCLDIGGNSSADSDETCSRIIAPVIKLHGNPAIGNHCEGQGVEDIGRSTVRLYL